jgi:hypothetical protein
MLLEIAFYGELHRGALQAGSTGYSEVLVPSMGKHQVERKKG